MRSLFILTLNYRHATNYGPSQIETLCRQNFQMWLKQGEINRYNKQKNMEGKGEIARCGQFLLFSQCFS